MKVGRNESCPCGSGKKFKRCCLGVAVVAEAAPMVEEELELDDRAPALEEGLAPLSLADFSGEPRSIEECLEELDRILAGDDGELEPIDVLSELRGYVDDARLRGMVEQLRERRPELYEQDEHWYSGWIVRDALMAGRPGDVMPLLGRVARVAAKDMDLFDPMLDAIAYDLPLESLLRLAREAWPLVRVARDITREGIEAFRERVMTFEMLAGGDGLVERLRTYDERAGEAVLTERIRALRGEQAWKESLLHPESGLTREHRRLLGLDFLGFLVREGAAAARAQMASEALVEYLSLRLAGDPGDGASRHRLCPERDTVDRYVAGLLEFFKPQPHRAAAFFASLPSWLRFMESRGLVEPSRAALALDEVQLLARSLQAALEHYEVGPHVREGVVMAVAAPA